MPNVTNRKSRSRADQYGTAKKTKAVEFQGTKPGADTTAIMAGHKGRRVGVPHPESQEVTQFEADKDGLWHVPAWAVVVLEAAGFKKKPETQDTADVKEDAQVPQE